MSKRPGECPKGGDHVTAFPAKVEGGYLVHRCKKCGTVLDKRPLDKRMLVLA